MARRKYKGVQSTPYTTVSVRLYSRNREHITQHPPICPLAVEETDVFAFVIRKTF